MEKIINKYYKGFEGEPEIQFICYDDVQKLILRMWVGYFDNIMNAIKPESLGWTGLAYFYHMHEGWYDNSPWEIPDIQATIEQFKNINSDLFDNDTKCVFNDIFDLLLNAYLANQTVWIAYE